MFGGQAEVSRRKQKIRELVEKCGAFRHFHEVGDALYIFNEIRDLTGFCVPSLRTIGGVFRVDYEYGMAVPMENPDRKTGLAQSLTERRSVILPRTIKPSHSLDMLLYGDGLSQWLTNDMVAMMQRFTLQREMALQFIQESDDRFLRDLKAVYREKFTDWITEPLIRSVPSA